jgi:hypothetical protein
MRGGRMRLCAVPAASVVDARTEMVWLASAIRRRRRPDGNRDGNDGSHQQPGPPWWPANWPPSERAIRLTLAEAFRSEGPTSLSSTW